MATKYLCPKCGKILLVYDVAVFGCECGMRIWGLLNLKIYDPTKDLFTSNLSNGYIGTDKNRSD